MSKINLNDVDFDDEYGDEFEDDDFDQVANRKHRNRARKKIENLMEEKKLREMMHTEDSYWGD